jgi:pimeloyl-ACP methyl ester carboxylesterase
LTRETTTRLIATSLGNLNVRMIGSGPAALLWHGMFVDGTSWERVAPRLAESRTLVIPDGPAHGHSDPLLRTASLDDCATVAGEVLDGLGIAGPVDWVGNAWGGHVGKVMALTRPERIRSLVAVSAPPFAIGPELRRRITLLRPLLRAVGYRGPLLNAVLASQLAPTSADDPAIRRLVVESLRRPRREGIARAIQSFILERQDLTASLPHIAARTLFIATDDRGGFTPDDAQKAAAAVKRGEWAVASGARALVPVEQPEWLVREISRFWDED